MSAPAVQVLDDLLARRHSCRGYLQQAVPRATIEGVLAAAQRSASWCNAQPWQVHVLSAPATERAREALLAQLACTESRPDIPFPASYEGVYNERRRECGWRLYEAVGVERGDRVASAEQARENFRFFGAPHVAIVTTAASLGPYGAVDCGAFVGNFLLAAEARGLGSIAQAALATRAAFWREHLGLAEDRQVVCGISFGFKDPDHPANAFRTSRAPLAEVLHWID